MGVHVDSLGGGVKTSGLELGVLPFDSVTRATRIKDIFIQATLSPLLPRSQLGAWSPISV